MSKNISLMGAVFSDVPAVELPKDGGGTALFYDTTDATVTGNGQILNGYTAYSNGVLYTGSVTIQHYYTGSSTPSSSLGVNGDIYLQTSGA